MHALQRVAEPRSPLAIESRQRRREIALVLLQLRMLRLHQQDDLRTSVRNAVGRPLDQLRVRHSDCRLAPADPRLAVRRLAEHVEAPRPVRPFAHPRLVRVEEAVAGLGERRRLPLVREQDDLELTEGGRDLVEPAVRRGDLEIVVLSMPAPEEDVDRPTRGDVPRNANVGQKPRDVRRTPRLPLRLERVDRGHERNCGSTFSANSRICSCRFAPHSSSMTCVQPASRYSSIASTQSAGVPAIGLHRSRIESVTCSFAARRPPRSIASATGRISSTSMFARSSSVSAAPRMFCTLLARYIPAISRAPSRPSSRSSAIDATIVQPMSMSVLTFSRVCRTNAGVVIDGVRQPSPISPASACILGAVAATYTGGTSLGASACIAGTSALHVSPSYRNASPPSTPRTIATASRIGPSVLFVCIRAL